MRPVRILLVVIGLLAAGITVWALGGGGDPYRATQAGQAATATTQAPAQAEPAAPVEPAPQVPAGVDTPAPEPTPPAPRPRIFGFGSEPVLGSADGPWRLPPGSGEAYLITDASHATKVEFLLTPTGTGTAGQAVTLGVDSDGSDAYTARWRYADQPLLAHLTVRASGPGGVTEHVVNVYHPDPAAQP
jgi:hypothetical protein